MSTEIFETGTDKWRALAFALLLHVLVVAALFFGLLWQREPPPVSAAAGEIEATLITSPRAAAAASKAVLAAEQAQQDSSPPPQPIPERAPQTAHIAPQLKPQQAQDQPDTVDQQRVSALALQAVEQQKKEQEEKHRQEQILLQQQAQNEAENKQRLAAQQLKDKQIADIQHQLDQAARKTKLEEQKLQQIRDLRAHSTAAAIPAPPGPVRAPAGNKGDDSGGLRARYIAAIHKTATDNWIHQEEVPKLVHCHILFTQMIGGEVIDISYQNCQFDAVARETIERAMHKETMPYTGYEKVYSRQITLDFCYPEEACAK